jgi:hypothetical protein
VVRARPQVLAAARLEGSSCEGFLARASGPRRRVEVQQAQLALHLAAQLARQQLQQVCDAVALQRLLRRFRFQEIQVDAFSL